MQKTSIIILIFLFLLVASSFGEQSNAALVTLHKLINEANAVDRRLLDEATGKGMGDAAKAESGRAWTKVKDYLESLSLNELVETASSAAEPVNSRPEVKGEWEREAASASDVEMILSVFKRKNPSQSDINTLVSKIADKKETLYFRKVLIGWLGNQILQKEMGPDSYYEPMQEKFLEKSYAVLVDDQDLESVRITALKAYCNVVVHDIKLTCKSVEKLRYYKMPAEEKNRLIDSVGSGAIDVPQAVKTRLLERNKNILQLGEIMEEKFNKKEYSSEFKDVIDYVLLQLTSVPIGTNELEKVSKLQVLFQRHGN